MNIKTLVKPCIPKVLWRFASLLKATLPVSPRVCLLCDYKGYFMWYGSPPRLDAQCPKCESLERHRLLWLLLTRQKLTLQEPVLHFAPELKLSEKLRELFKHYKTADLYMPADLPLNIENIALEDNSVGVIICNHVLEHVNDKLALSELHRILKPEGYLLITVPMIEGWNQTFEPEHVVNHHDRKLYFGQKDHVRMYGKDIRDRIKSFHFTLNEFTAEGEDVIRFGLIRGEKIFICQKNIYQ